MSLTVGGIVRRVGWIRIGALGDLLVGLASLRETLDMWPEARVSVVGPKLWLQLIEPGYWSRVDRIVVIEKRGTSADCYEIKDGSWSLLATKSLRQEFGDGYDVVFNARVDSPRQGFAAFWARVPERWGSAAGLPNLIYNRRAPHDGKDPLIHERDVPLLLMDEAEASASGDRKFSKATLAERIAASPRIAKWRGAGLPAPRRIDGESLRVELGADRYFVVNPTSSRREKAWPAGKFRELLETIRENGDFGGVMPIVVGAPSETEWLREVAGDDFRMIQPSSIGALFNVIAGAELLLTNTSSVQFIAASVGTRTLTLMGRAKPEIWGPLGPSDRFLLGVEPLEIDSMFDRELRAYESISVQSVLETLRTLSPESRL
jgi:ADP-heptose:LPS heptosyltransferase